jgi:photosynthetic reaction center cytochrome c subunit
LRGGSVSHKLGAKSQERLLRTAKKFCLLGAGSTLAATLLTVALLTAHAQSPAAPKLAEQQYKNIKVLKGIPAEQVIPAMQFITASLGVDCEYCHVRDGHNMAFDKDDKKPKLAARKMIEMMNGINKDNFEAKREVTCFSCHRGAAEPVGIPLVGEAAKAEPPGEKSTVDAQAKFPPADQLLDKYLAAVGGANALGKIASRVQKGTLTGFGNQRMPIDVYGKAPDKRVSVMHFPNGDSVTAFDGHSGWLSFPGRPPHIMNGDENNEARMDADLLFPVHVKTMRQKFLAGPGEKIDGHDTIQVVGRSEGQAPLRLFFDAQSGLLLRMVRYTETPLGRLPTQIDYSDYRDADGVKVPFRWSLARPGNRFNIQVDELQQNVPVDDAKFAPPPPPPPEQKPAAH